MNRNGNTHTFIRCRKQDSYDRPTSPIKQENDSSAPPAPATSSANDGWGAPPAEGDSAIPRYEPPHQRRQSRSPYPDRRGDDYVPPRRERCVSHARDR